MGFKRRRDNHTPRLSPFETKLRWLRQHVVQIGEPSRHSTESVMRMIIDDVVELGERVYTPLLNTLRATIREQPHKITHLSFIIMRCPEQVQFLALEMAHDEAQRAVLAGQFEKCKVFVRFLCAMHPIISNKDALQKMLRDLVTSGVPQLYRAALLAAFYLPPNLVPSDLRDLFVSCVPEDHIGDQFDPFLGDKSPYKVRHLSELYKEVAESLKQNWNVDILPTDPLNGSDQAKLEVEGLPPKPDAKPEVLSSSNVDPEAGAEQEPDIANLGKSADEENAKESVGADLEAEPNNSHTTSISELVLSDLPSSCEPGYPSIYFQCYFPVDDVNMVPPPNTPIGLLIRDVAIDVIQKMDFNRKEVTRQLIALDLFFKTSLFAPPGAWPDQIIESYKESNGTSPTFKIEDIALEAIFANLFNLEAPQKTQRVPPLVYYHSLLVEACVCAPQDIAPVLGRGLRFLFNNLESADIEVLFTLIDWFSHHVSNFAYTWKWSEWTDVLELPKLHPKQVVIRELIAKQVRLSYTQRIEEVLPDEFKGLVPHVPEVPSFKYKDDERAQKLQHLLANTEDESLTEANALLNDMDDAIDVLISTVCHLGNRSVTHASTWIAKSESLIRSFCSGDQQKTIAAVFEYWSGSVWVGSLVINQLIKLNLLNSSELVKHIVEHQDLLISSLGYECLLNNLEDANKQIDNINVQGDWGEWWTVRLKKAIHRKFKVQVEEDKAQNAEPITNKADMEAGDGVGDNTEVAELNEDSAPKRVRTE